MPHQYERQLVSTSKEDVEKWILSSLEKKWPYSFERYLRVYNYTDVSTYLNLRLRKPFNSFDCRSKILRYLVALKIDVGMYIYRVVRFKTTKLILFQVSWNNF